MLFLEYDFSEDAAIGETGMGITLERCVTVVVNFRLGHPEATCSLPGVTLGLLLSVGDVLSFHLQVVVVIVRLEQTKVHQ